VQNPEQGAGPLDQASGTWGTIEFTTPDFLEPVRDAVNTFFSILINILNILLAVLEVLKVFIGAFLDPIIALIEAILALVQQILNDLRNAGLYIHGDFYILKGPDFKELRGGFQSYEQRMITRLVDRRDPNRPNISNFSTCIAVFLYVGVDISAVQQIIRFLQGILQLFNRKAPRPKTVGQVVGVQAKYGLDGASVLTFGKGLFRPFKRGAESPFNAVNLTWSMAPVPGNFLTNFAQFAPTGFIIDVSTVRDPMPLFFDKQVDLNRMELTQQPAKIKPGFAIDQDDNPIQLTGGADQLLVQPLVQYNFNSKLDGQVKDGMLRAYTAKGLADQAPIDLSQLKDGNKYYIQRSFYISRSSSAFYPGRGYGVTLKFEDLPLDADWELNGSKVKRGPDVQPTSYFVRIRAVSKNVTALTDYRLSVNSVALDQPRAVLAYANNNVSPGDFGDPSFPLEVSFPDAVTDQFLLAVAQALILLVLTRTDVDVLRGENDSDLIYPPTEGMKDSDGTPLYDRLLWSSFVSKARKRTGLETKAQVLLPLLTGKRKAAKYFNREKVDPARFRRRLRKAALNLANDLIADNNPPRSLKEAVVNQCQPLLEFTWADALSDNIPSELEGMSLLEAVTDSSVEYGVTLNQASLGYDSDTAVKEACWNIYSGQAKATGASLLEPGPHFFFNEKLPKLSNISSVDMAPVLYSRSLTATNQNPTNPTFIEYIRNLIPDDVYSAAAFALQVAAGPVQRPQEEGWIAFRLFPQGLPDIDRFFDQILALLKSIQAAIQGLADLINKYIEMLQSRILELQAFLNRINHIIQQLLNLFISIPPTSGLVVVANGTDGVLSSLVNANNKPFDPPETYGGGVVLLAGGLPTIALELFKALFSSDE
jgi:hypothetical protein